MTATEMRARSAQATAAEPPLLERWCCCCCVWRLACCCCCLLLDLIYGRDIQQRDSCCCHTPDRCAARELSASRPIKFATAAIPLAAGATATPFAQPLRDPDAPCPACLRHRPHLAASHCIVVIRQILDRCSILHAPSLDLTARALSLPNRTHLRLVSTASPSANEYMLRRSFEHPP